MKPTARNKHRSFQGAQVIAQFRAGLAFPLLIVFAVSLMVIPIGIQQPGPLALTLFGWMLLVLVVLRRWRAAATFTSDSLYVRPWLGRTERLSLKGIKRAYIHPGMSDEDGSSVRVVLLVGGEIRVTVPQMERVVYLLNKGAGKGLDVPNTPGSEC